MRDIVLADLLLRNVNYRMAMKYRKPADHIAGAFPNIVNLKLSLAVLIEIWGALVIRSRSSCCRI